MSPVLRAFIAALVSLFAGSAFGGTVTGTVTAADTHQPVRAMVVTAYDASGSVRGTATTDATGLYVLTLAAGSYRVLAYDPTGAYAVAFNGNAESFETTPLTTLGATQTVTLDFALPVAGTITGIVTSPLGINIQNGVVEVYNLSGTRRGFTTTNAQGTYSLAVPAGQYKLVAYDEAAAFAASFYRDARDFAAATPVTVNARDTTRAIDFRLGIAARVTGSIVDAGTNAAVPAIDVYAFTEAGVLVSSTRSDAGGVFRFALPEGRYRFAAGDATRSYAPAYFANKRSFATADVVQLIAGQTVPGVQIALTRAAILGGRVTDAGGLAIGAIVVAAYNADGTLQTSTVTASDGRWELAVAAGSLRLAAFDPALVYATKFHAQRTAFAIADAISVAAGERITNFDFALDRGGRVTGVVTDAVTLQPLGGIRIAAYDAAGLLVGQATSNANGTYALVVPAGATRVLAFDEQLRFATRYDGNAKNFEATPPRTLAAGATSSVNFALVRGVRVSGTVTDRNGTAISGVEILALDAAGNHVAATVANNGVFAIIVLADSYRFLVHDPAGRYPDLAQTLIISDGQSPTLTFVLTGSAKRRASRH